MDHALRNTSLQPAELVTTPSAQDLAAPGGVVRPEGHFTLWIRVAWFVWLLLGLRLTVRGFDPDELEHLHAAFCLQAGQLPYRDFFEHHAPALYWLAQPVLSFTGPRLTALWILRLGMWLLSTLSVLATARTARRVVPGDAASLIPGLLLGSSIFFAKGVEFRPDVPAMLLLVWALERGVQATAERVADRSTAAKHSDFWIMALCAGGATLFTQKAIVPVVALGGAIWLVETRAGRALRWPRALGWMLGGVMVGWGGVLLGYWWVGGAHELLDSTVFQLVRWSVPSEKLATLRATLAADLLIWWLAACGLAAGLARAVGWKWSQSASPAAEWSAPAGSPVDAFHRSGATHSIDGANAGSPHPGSTRFLSATHPPGASSVRDVAGHLSASRPDEPCSARVTVVLLATLACLGSLTVVKATFPQYYLLWFPWLALTAGSGLQSLLTAYPPGQRRIALGVGGLLLVAQLGWLMRGWSRGEAGPFPHLTAENPLAMTLLAVGVFWLAWGLGWRGALLDDRRPLLVWGGALALGYGVCRQLDLLAWSNAAQIEAIEQLHAQVPPGGRVLDGFTGWGALRPHAYRIWWLNEFSMGLIPPPELERELLEMFDQKPPDAVLDDANLQRLPPAVRARIESEYEPVAPAPLRVRSSAVGR
jgi:hypothetical protein